MKPSDIYLDPGAPLVSTMGRAEIEHAATLLVRACQALGDEWQPIMAKQVGEVMKADIEAGVEPIKSLARNPFFRPDFHELVARGFAQGDLANHGPIALTEKGIATLARWRKVKDGTS